MTSAEIKEAMQTFAPVKCRGVVYKRITAYIYRVIPLPMTNTFKGIIQVELLDRNENSVTIAEADKVELVR